MLLDARGVSKSFQGFMAVNNADLRVEEGEIVGLIGPNGAGKSTFFNCLCGDLMPSSGSVLFDGHDVTHAAPEAHALRGMGRTFQVPATFGDLSVLENAMVGAFLRFGNRNQARQEAERVIDLTGMTAQAHQPAHSLGTPGRKRLEIARVLATRPRLMLLDEALAGLNPAEIRQAIELVRKIHDSGVTLVIVEHIMEVILSLAHRVVVFNQGELIASGKPQDVVNNPQVVEAYLGKRRVSAGI